LKWGEDEVTKKGGKNSHWAPEGVIRNSSRGSKEKEARPTTRGLSYTSHLRGGGFLQKKLPKKVNIGG